MNFFFNRARDDPLEESREQIIIVRDGLTFCWCLGRVRQCIDFTLGRLCQSLLLQVVSASFAKYNYVLPGDNFIMIYKLTLDRFGNDFVNHGSQGFGTT